MSLRYAGATDSGRRRRRNEDSYVVAPPLFAIADGMGGAQAGEVASRLAAGVLEEAQGDERGEARLAELIQEANRRVHRRSNEDVATAGMGTTMTVALVDGTAVAFGHVGDSRAYRVRGGELEQLTDDHSLVGELVRSGKLSPEDAEHHPQRSVITRALGTEADVDVDTFTVEAEPDDLFLLCSDGLTDMISGREILAAVEGTDDLDRSARALVAAANANGGEDNITVILFQVGAGGTSGETVPMPAVADPERPDDEDTLSGLEALPAVDTAVVPAAEIEQHLAEARAASGEPGLVARFLPLFALLFALALIAVLVLWGLAR